MKYNFFWKYLVFLSLVSVVLIAISALFSVFRDGVMLAIIGLFFMVLTSIAYYYATKKTLASPNKMAFIQLVMMTVVLKIILIMTIVALYYKAVKPQSKYFIFPFLIIYFIFSVFETIFSYKMAKSQ